MKFFVHIFVSLICFMSVLSPVYADSIIPIEFETDGTFTTPTSVGCEFGKEVTIPINGYDTAYLNDDFTTNILVNGQIKFTCGERNNIKLAYYGINSLWYVATSNMLNTTQQTYVCDNYNWLNSFDTIFYYTDSNALIWGNYSYSDAYVRFNNCYVMESDGTFSRQNQDNSGFKDGNNVGAVFKSNGAFNITTNKMSLLKDPCIVYYTVTLNSSPTVGGTVSGGGTFEKGKTATISATPNTDYRFSSWSDGNTSNPRVITLNSNLNLTANFVSTVTSPNVNLPTPNEPNISINSSQSNYIDSISSPGSFGSVINYFRYDYFNIYAVHSTAINQEIGYGTEDLLIKYQIDSTGRYLIPVYDHSEVVIYGPNLTISTSGLEITSALFNDISYSFPISFGTIQSDVNRFDYTYVDLDMLNNYPYIDLPFSNSSTNTGKIDYLGQQLSVRSGGTGSRSIMLEFNGQNYSTTFYIVSTDSFDDINQGKEQEIQNTINNNIISNFNELDNTLQHGNTLTQNSQTAVNNINNQFNDSYDRYADLEQSLINDYNNNLNAIDLDTYKISNNLDLLNTANFVRSQFDRLTTNTPIGLILGFSLSVGLALLLIGKRL